MSGENLPNATSGISHRTGGRTRESRRIRSIESGDDRNRNRVAEAMTEWQVMHKERRLGQRSALRDRAMWNRGCEGRITTCCPAS
jgi:hypothetical protein